MKERQVAHHAAITRSSGGRIEWDSPDGRAGFIQRDGRRVILVETDNRESLPDAETFARAVTFIEPPEDAVRAAANSPLRRFNPFWSWQKDGDYAVTRSLAACSRAMTGTAWAPPTVFCSACWRNRAAPPPSTNGSWAVAWSRGTNPKPAGDLPRQPCCRGACSPATVRRRCRNRRTKPSRARVFCGDSARAPRRMAAELPHGASASFWSAPVSHRGTRAGIHTCSGHGPLSHSGDRSCRCHVAFPPARHSDLDYSRAPAEEAIGHSHANDHPGMRRFLTTLPCNILGCFKGRMIPWHLAVIILTVTLVTTGCDWRYFAATRNPILRSWMFPAAPIGGLVPLALPLLLLILGRLCSSAQTTLAGWAVGQAELIAALIAATYKAFTGRVHPLRGLGPDISHMFQFGFLRGGVFWGWPSSHTTIAFAMAVTLFRLFPQPRWLGYVALAYAFYIGLGVSMTIHWFSDFAAGAILGTVIGTVVGRSFQAVTGEDPR